MTETQLNMETIEVLREMDQGSGFFAELVGEYIRQGDELLTEIRGNVEARNHEQVRFAVHTLKGSSYNLGADQVAAVCLEIEAADKAVDDARLKALLLRLEESYRSASDALQSLE